MFVNDLFDCDDLRVCRELGQFRCPTAYLYTNNQMVLTVGIVSGLVRVDVFSSGKIMAGYVRAAAPPALIFPLLMHDDAAGLTAGATKG